MFSATLHIQLHRWLLPYLWSAAGGCGWCL